MSRYLPPVSGGPDCKVRPGPVTAGACPPPTEIVVIETKKVYDFCFQDDQLERCFVVPELGEHGSILDCKLVGAQCSEVQARESVHGKQGFVTVCLRIDLALQLTVLPGPGEPWQVTTRRVVLAKQVALCAPPGTDVTCQVKGTCACVVQPTVDSAEQPNVCCTIHLSVVVTASAVVKLLVPSFGVVLPKACLPAVSCAPSLWDQSKRW